MLKIFSGARIEQFIHTPTFLTQYQRWWTKKRPLPVIDVEFAVLILRICDYATQFLPSPSHTLDKIRGLSLPEIRNVCSSVGDSLAKCCATLDPRGSLTRVQHLSFTAMKSWSEGRADPFWEGLLGAIRVAQKVGIHKDIGCLERDTKETEGKIARRTFCNLYVLDRFVLREAGQGYLINGTSKQHCGTTT